jgi:uncharacterized protein YaaN involved in tellurite resistance
MTDELKDVTPVNSTLDDLLSNPFEAPDTSKLSVQEDKKLQTNTSVATKVIDKLPEDRQKQARELAAQIDTSDSQAVLSYGVAAQQKLGEFSHTMLNHVQAQDIGPMGDSLTELMYRLNEASPSELEARDSNIFRKMFGKVKQSVYEVTAKYQKNWCSN